MNSESKQNNNLDYSNIKDIAHIELSPFISECKQISIDGGIIFYHPTFTMLRDSNFVLLNEKVNHVSIKKIEKIALPIFESKGIFDLHFFIILPDNENEISKIFEQAGYKKNKYSIMYVSEKSTRNINTDIKISKAITKSDFAILDQIESDLMRQVSWNSPLIRAALRTRRREITSALNLSWYIAFMEINNATNIHAGSGGLLFKGDCASIQAISTRPAFRGKSVATTLILSLIKCARESEIKHISLLTDISDWPHMLYSQLGFSEIGSFLSFVKY